MGFAAGTSAFEREYKSSREESLRAWLLAQPRGGTDDAGGRVSALRGYLRRFPDLIEHDLALDAALSTTVCDPGLADDAAEEAAARASDEFPALREAIERCGMMNRLFGGSPGGDRPSDGAELPEGFGPPIEGGGPRYRRIEDLGSGGVGRVVLAEDRLMSQAGSAVRVSVKIVPRTAGDRAGLIEARRARQVRHPNVIQMLDAGSIGTGSIEADGESGFEYFVYANELGEPLRRVVEGGLPAKAACRLILDLARGVEAIHAAGLSHGDLKPGNVLVRADGSPVILDFGSARPLEGAGVLAARAGINAGVDDGIDDRNGGGGGAFTLGFVSPERFGLEGEPAGQRDDVFALGAMLAWLLTGRCITGETAAEALEVLGAGGAALQALAERRLREAGVAGSLVRIVLRALAPSDAGRYPSATALASDIEAWLAHQPTSVTPDGVWPRLVLRLRREPLTHALAVGVVVGLAVAWGQSLEAAAARQAEAERAHEAEVERAKLEVEQIWKADAGKRLGDLIKSFTRARESGIEDKVLLSLWLLEWMHDESVLGDASETAQIWTARSEALLSVRERTRGSVLSKLTEPSLAVWLLSEGRAAEARDVAAEALAYWEPLVGSDDPWLTRLRVLEACAIVALGDESGRGEARALLKDVYARHIDKQDPGWVLPAQIERLVKAAIEGTSVGSGRGE